KVTLQPGEQATINVIVHVDPNAPDGLYQQQIVGEWGGVNEFLGTGIDVKIGKGATEFMIPSGVNNNG
ncbi:MAG TPA: hypothetical protein VFW99_05885, partial [Candidatus Nitrosotalea sp.]|nr:hypothetical protein [Candidatus Nitrosotalea sp.]